MEPGGFLAHVPGLNLGSTWEDSVALNDWKQQLCLQKELYAADVSGQQLAVLPGLTQTVSSISSFGIAASESSSFSVWSAWLQNGTGLTSQWLSYSLRGSPLPTYDINAFDYQLSSVQSICANYNSKEVLLIVWLVFGGCCVGLVGVYMVVQHRKLTSGTSVGAGWLRQVSDWGIVQSAHSAYQGPGSSAFYYHELVTSIIVLVQVWGKWPGDVLIAIFLFHFAATGLVVALHACRYLAAAQPATLFGRCFRPSLIAVV